MLTIACVLRSGGDYVPAHVHALRDGVARNLTLPHSFVCLTDMAVDCNSIPLKHRWPGWWSKIELFSALDGPVLYIDLDTIITGSLDEIVVGHTFTVLRNFWAVEYNEPDRIGSGLMAWDEDLSSIYKTFASKPDHFLRKYKTKGGGSPVFIRAHFGDQMFIQHHTPILMERWQDKYPGKVVSFKKHVLPNGGVPKGASVVCFHGLPRPFALPPNQRTWFDEVREAA